jgi:hypothetical protein
MKKLIIGMAIVVMAGCANHPMRTGKLVVNQFEAKSYTTNNPMQVKDDVAERLSENLRTEILRRLSKDTKMTMAKDCGDGDFELTGRFTEINSEIESHWRFILMTMNQKFDVYVTGSLKKCKTGETIAKFELDNDDENMTAVIDDIGKNVVGNINKDKSITLP